VDPYPGSLTRASEGPRNSETHIASLSHQHNTCTKGINTEDKGKPRYDHLTLTLSAPRSIIDLSVGVLAGTTCPAAKHLGVPSDPWTTQLLYLESRYASISLKI
jgi:hypothetical protein